MAEYTVTPNLGLFKPNFNQDDGAWAGHLNANADNLDALLGPAGSFLRLTGGTMLGSLALYADPILPVEATTKQYVDASIGAIAPSVTVLEYKVKTITTPTDPGTGNVQFDQANQSSAANLFIDSISAAGRDWTAYLLTLQVGQQITVQMISDHSRVARYTLRSAVVNNGGWLTIPVTPLSAIGFPVPNNTNVAIAILGLTGGFFLPLTGGTLTGPLTIGAGANNALTITPGATATAPIVLAQSGTGGIVLPTITVTSGTAPLLVNANTAQPSILTTTDLLQLIGKDATVVSMSLLGSGSGSNPLIIGRRSGGTLAAPSAVGSNVLLGLNGLGYGTTGWSAARVSINLRAAEAFTDTAQGTKVEFLTTRIGTTVTSVALTISDTGALQFATGPTITAGNGAPSSTQPNGSFYMRLDGTTGARLYVNQGGAAVWAPIPAI